MAQLSPDIDHLLRRAGFGASVADVRTFRNMSFTAAVNMAEALVTAVSGNVCFAWPASWFTRVGNANLFWSSRTARADLSATFGWKYCL